MLEIIRIRKMGFPVHFPYDEFLTRYSCILPRGTPRLRGDPKAASKALMETQGLPRREWQMGKSKLFLRACVHEPLEDMRLATLNARATVIQARWRGWVQRRRYTRRLAAARVIQARYLTWSARIAFLNKRRAAVVIQSHLRGMFAREVSQVQLSRVFPRNVPATFVRFLEVQMVV